MNEVNGKFYPLWSQFVERKDEWIGGLLEDSDDDIDRQIEASDGSFNATQIVDIRLLPNGKDSALFQVDGVDFDCSYDVKYLSIVDSAEGYITFSGYEGHTWRIKQKQKEQ